ncbi:hypothetical protein HanPI659440_Chr00c14g0727121 [Helianthus annuus]|nr:hypothetical protein HanPI659440_Chr00c14g0727121 [Helianthus annuus]
MLPNSQICLCFPRQMMASNAGSLPPDQNHVPDNLILLSRPQPHHHTLSTTIHLQPHHHKPQPLLPKLFLLTLSTKKLYIKQQR